MNIQQFKYLCELYETKSINAAADNLFVSHQSVSKSIRSLEKELNCTILSRSSKGVVFTKDGEFILGIARKITDAVNELEEYIKTDQPDIVGELAFLSSPHPYKTTLLPTLRYFHKNYPKVTLNATLCENPTLFSKLLNNEGEFGVINLLEVDKTFSSPIPSSLSFVETRRYRMYAIFSDSHPLARYKKPSLKTLCHYPAIILPSSSDLRHSSSLLFLKSFYLEQTIEANSERGFIQFLEDGLGWGLVPDFSLTELPQTLTHCPIKEQVYAVDGYIKRKDVALSTLSQLFLDHFSS